VDAIQLETAGSKRSSRSAARLYAVEIAVGIRRFWEMHYSKYLGSSSGGGGGTSIHGGV